MQKWNTIYLIWLINTNNQVYIILLWPCICHTFFLIIEMRFTPQGGSSGPSSYYEKVDDVHSAVIPQHYEQPIALTNKVTIPV